MTSVAILEAAAFFITAIVLGLAHLRNYNRHDERKAEAEDTLRLESIRQNAVQQLKSEHQMWSVGKQGTGA
jgi:preprotein translocase subunit SecG